MNVKIALKFGSGDGTLFTNPIEIIKPTYIVQILTEFDPFSAYTVYDNSLGIGGGWGPGPGGLISKIVGNPGIHEIKLTEFTVGDDFFVSNSEYYVVAIPDPKGGISRLLNDAKIDDRAFLGVAGLKGLYLAGSGDQSVALGAKAEAAFENGHAWLRDSNAATNFAVDATGLSSHAKLTLFADSGVAHFTLGAENDTVYFNSTTWALAGRTVDGGGGTNVLKLTFTGTIADADFVGLAHLTKLDLVGTSHAGITLGAQAQAAFTGPIKVAALNNAVISIDGHALSAGFFATGAAGADTFIGGAGNDTFTGKGGADVFMLGQGGHDRITDFTHGQDHIDLHAAGVHSLTEITMRRAGADAVLTFAGQDVRLTHVDFHTLTASDFIFA